MQLIQRTEKYLKYCLEYQVIWPISDAFQHMKFLTLDRKKEGEKSQTVLSEKFMNDRLQSPTY